MSEENEGFMDKVEDTFDDVIDDVKNEDGSLPQFLNVLTILTFVGSGLGIISNIWGFFALGSLKSLAGNLGSLGDATGLAKYLANAEIIIGVAILACIGSIVGALQMRKLKKTGFYIYAASNVVALAVALILGGSYVMAGMGIVNILVTVAFIVMYGMNLKHMK